jgi:hypothetical protein
VQATCEECGIGFEAQRSTAKFCTTRCRTRATRRRADGRPAPALEAPPQALSAPQHGEDVPLLVAATIGELAAAGRLSTTLGQTAVKLAERLVSRSETGSAVASLSKELRATMAAALAGGKTGEDPLDEFTERRHRKASGG